MSWFPLLPPIRHSALFATPRRGAHRLFGLLAGLLLFAALPLQAALPSGLSGLWYQPERPGHGLSITQFAPDSALLLWQTYDPQGRPLHLYAEAAVDAGGMRGTAFAPGGLGFAARDGGELQLPEWGELSLQFHSCDRATLRWQARDAAFASGEVALQRLVHTEGLTCQLPGHGLLPTGVYQGVGLRDLSSGEQIRTDWVGAADAQGRLWAFEYLLGDDPLEARNPGARFWNEVQLLFAASTPSGAPDGSSLLEAEVREQSVRDRNPRSMARTTAMLSQSAGEASFELRFSSQKFGRQTWTTAPPGLEVEPNAGLQAIAGLYAARTLDLHVPGTSFHEVVQVRPDGSLCAGYHLVPTLPEACNFVGSLRNDPSDLGFFDFELSDQSLVAGRVYRGRAFVLRRGERRALVMIGHAGNQGLAWVARPIFDVDFR